jgi:hypothetical protein
MVNVGKLDGLIRWSGCRCRTTMAINWDGKGKATCILFEYLVLLVFRLAILVLGSLWTISS